MPQQLASRTSFDPKARFLATAKQLTRSNTKVGERDRAHRDEDSEAQQRFTVRDQLLTLGESQK